MAAILLSARPADDATPKYAVNLGRGAIACTDYLTLDRIAIAAASQTDRHDRLSGLIALSLINGDCRDLRYSTVALNSYLWNYARITAFDGGRYFILREAIESHRITETTLRTPR